MMPENRFSSEPVPGEFLYPDNRSFSSFEDWEYGGIAHQDPSEGLMYQVWRAWLDDDGFIYVQPTNLSQPRMQIAEAAGGTYISLAFDRNMRVAVAWRVSNVVYLYWYSALEQDYTISAFPGARSPRLTHDDKRDYLPEWDDVILFYLMENEVIVRNQRDRYTIPHVVGAVDKAHHIYRVGMTDKLRIQLEVQ